jgi:putative transcriptional regulator
MRSGFCHPVSRCATRAVCAFVLLLGTPWLTSADDQKPLTAMLLVARGQLADRDFKDSVVLVMNNLGPAPAGLIINRPTKFAVSQLFPDLERLAQLHDKLYFGGPVEIESVWFLFRTETPREHAVQAVDGVYVSANKELLLELLARDKPMDGLRIFIGHSGWAPGQLQAEIAHGDWSLSAADKDAIFSSKSEHPWPTPPAKPGA